MNNRYVFLHIKLEPFIYEKMINGNHKINLKVFIFIFTVLSNVLVSLIVKLFLMSHIKSRSLF
jgi:hypothetical protein